MILCLGCKKLWPSDANWCGTCRCTLGKRICQEGHSNYLTSECCTTCGSRILSTGVKCVNLRPISWIVLSILMCSGVVFLLPPLVSATGNGLRSLWNQVLMFLLGPVLTLVILRIILQPFLGEKGSDRKSVV